MSQSITMKLRAITARDVEVLHHLSERLAAFLGLQMRITPDPARPDVRILTFDRVDRSTNEFTRRLADLEIGEQILCGAEHHKHIHHTRIAVSRVAVRLGRFFSVQAVDAPDHHAIVTRLPDTGARRAPPHGGRKPSKVSVSARIQELDIGGVANFSEHSTQHIRNQASRIAQETGQTYTVNVSNGLTTVTRKA